MNKTYIFYYDKDHPVDDARHEVFLAHDEMKCTADVEEVRISECVNATFDDGTTLYVFDYELDEVEEPKKNVYLMKIESFFPAGSSFGSRLKIRPMQLSEQKNTARDILNMVTEEITNSILFSVSRN